MQNNFDGEQIRLKKAVSELSALNRIANAINALMTVNEITQRVVDLSIKHICAQQGAVFLLDQKDSSESRFKTFCREFSQSSEDIPFHLNESISGWMIKNKTIFVCKDVNADERFKFMKLNEVGIKSILSAPLITSKGLLGSLVLFNKSGGDEFNDDDKRFLGIVGSQVARVIEIAQYREQEEKFIETERELKLAHKIQKRFLPQEGIKLSSCEAIGINIPAKDVGGDYYDLVQIDENRLFLSIGDVSGKGMPAALLMANAQAVLRSQLEKENINLIDLARKLNHLIYSFTEPEQFITAVFGIYHQITKEFSYINAGHEPPIVCRNGGTIERYPDSDLIVGIMPEVQYQEHIISMGTGDFLFLCTDGIAEAFDESGEQLGEENMKNLIGNCRGMSVNDISQNIIGEMIAYRGEASQSDDITMVILST
ncbi:MAG: GAF domain-containing SpoIIE family protein phosphatase [Candidatus Zixiibacteriota bacterium]